MPTTIIRNVAALGHRRSISTGATFSNDTVNGNWYAANTFDTAVKRTKPRLSAIDAWTDKTSWNKSFNRFDGGNLFDYRLTSAGIIYRNTVKGHGAPPNSQSFGFVPTDIAATDPPSGMYNTLRGKFRDESVNLAMMLAEYRQTATLFRELIPDFIRVARTVLTRNPRYLLDRPRRTWSKQTSSDWLKFQYGVTPLMNDVHDSMKALKTGIDRNDMYLQKRVLRKSNKSWTLKGASVFNSLEPRITEVDGLRRTTVYGRARNKNSLLLTSLGAYGFTNPVSLAWEVIPFSFVVDWWFNVGDVLQSLDNALYFDDFRTYVVTKRAYLWQTSVAGRMATGFERSYNRTSPVATTRVNSFTYKPSVSRNHVLNGIALLTQLLGSTSYRR